MLEQRFCSRCGAFRQGRSVCECGFEFPPDFDAPPASAGTFSYTGDAGQLVLLHLKNLVFCIFTLGIYNFWGRTNIRRYVHSELRFNGEPFAYHGTASELIQGWLKAMVLVIVLYAGYLLPLFLLGRATGVIVGQIVLIVLATVLAPLAILGTFRYRLARTSYRGIRFSCRGRYREFLGIYVRTTLLTIVTLGIYTPWAVSEVFGFLTNHTYWGNRRFRYDGSGNDIWTSYLLMFLLLFPTLGIYVFFAQAKLGRYFWGRTTFGDARFQSTITGGGLLGLGFVNFLILILTFGLGSGWAQTRMLRYHTANLTLEGAIDFAAVQQEIQGSEAAGEELAGILGGDFDFDMGL